MASQALRPGHKLSKYSKETADRSARALPHKHTSLFLYRDYMRVINRKYEGSQVKYLKNAVRHCFVTYKYLEDKERMQMVGEGTRFIGLMACAEELHDAGLKNSYLKDVFSRCDEQDRGIDPKRYQVAPYVFSYDIWKNYGLDDYGQSTAWIRFYNNIKDTNRLYDKEADKEHDAARLWLLDRQRKLEDNMRKERQEWFDSMPEEQREQFLMKVRTIFDRLDEEKTGRLDYPKLSPLFEKTTQEYVAPEGYFWIIDEVDGDYEKGLTFDQFLQMYTTLDIFEVDEHFDLCVDHPKTWIKEQDIDPRSLVAAEMARRFEESGETYFENIEPMKVEDLPPGAQVLPKNREESLKPRFTKKRRYNITKHRLPHNVHELGCMVGMAALYYPKIVYEERLLKRIKEEEDKPHMEIADLDDDPDDEIAQNSLGPAKHLRSDDPEQPDVLFRRAGEVSGEVFGVRCEFGPLNKFIPMKNVVLPSHPQFLYDMPPESLQDTIPLVRRGGGKFVDKVRRAQDAGAAAVLLWNDQKQQDVMSIHGDGPDIKIPTIFINDPEIGFELTRIIEEGGKPSASFSTKTGWTNASDLCRRALLVRQLERLESQYLDEYLNDHNLEIPNERQKKLEVVSENIFQNFEAELQQTFMDKYLIKRVNDYDKKSFVPNTMTTEEIHQKIDEAKQEMDLMEAVPI